MTRYEVAATAASMVSQIRSNTKPWSVANAALRPMTDRTLFTDEEVLKVEAFLEATAPGNREDEAERLADQVRDLIQVIEPAGGD